MKESKEIIRLLKELRDRDWTKNHEERIDEIEKVLLRVQGNNEGLEKRLKAMERYLKVTFIQEQKYENHRNRKNSK